MQWQPVGRQLPRHRLVQLQLVGKPLREYRGVCDLTGAELVLVLSLVGSEFVDLLKCKVEKACGLKQGSHYR